MKKIKKKKRRSDSKIITRKVTVLKVMRESRKLSKRRAAVLAGVSDTSINHLEHGRLDLNPEIIQKLLIAYGYAKYHSKSATGLRA
jgi:DNA-binding XRE family transcriptional regulator